MKNRIEDSHGGIKSNGQNAAETRARELIDLLEARRKLSLEEYAQLVSLYSPEIAAYAAEKAVRARKRVYGNAVFVRGLIEIGNYCKNDCLYCGIRRSNDQCSRYRLSPNQILDCCREGFSLGLRTFVLQGGEDGHFTDEMLCALIRDIKAECPGCAVTLSLWERGGQSFRQLRKAGADRYLLRHETADEAHYRRLHPPEMSFAHRMACLTELKSLGYQTGCGFMVGSPGQTQDTLAQDLKFIEEFQPEMCGIGPFVPHHATPFRNERAGSVEMTCYLLSIVRLISPGVLLPSTTALGTIAPHGREMGILAGANVVMPNLSPASVRKKYELYDNKRSTGEESAQCLAALAAQMQSIGYETVSHRGDVRIEPFSDGEDVLTQRKEEAHGNIQSQIPEGGRVHS